jgi:putative tricarboxylic transport membrane protein
METLHLIATGFQNAIVGQNLLMMLVGLAVGLIAGVLPGISMINAVILALPFTYFLDPASSIILLVSIYCSGMFAGGITAILINIPGSPGNAATCWDGYPMALKGQAALAIGTCILCSGIGGFASAVIMTFATPQLAEVALSFSSVEAFAMIFLGMACVGRLGARSASAAFTSLLLGMAVGSIGLAPVYSSFRFTFGTEILQAGVNFLIALIGLFAIGEVLDRIFAGESGWKEFPARVQVRMPGLKELFQIRWTLFRATAIGTLVGLVPGEGGVVSAFLAYGVEKQISKNGSKFGTGQIEGVAAPETANNASTGGAMIPTLALGIPGSAAAAVIMGAFMVHGFEPGPLLFVKAPDIIYTTFAAIMIVNLLMIVGGYFVTKMFVQMMKVPAPILNGCILTLCFIGAFGIRNLMVDVWMMMGFGVLGLIMRRTGFPVPAFIIGLLLGPMAETYFLTSMIASDNNILVFFTRPVSATIMLASMLIIFVPTIRGILRNRNRTYLVSSGDTVA